MKTAVLFLLVLVATGGISWAGDEPRSPLGRELLLLVREASQGQEVVRVSGETTTIAHDAMLFQVHEPDRMGRMQRPREETGPNTSGVVIEIRTLDGPYGGPLSLPQTLGGPYYATHVSELAEDGTHQIVKARFGTEFPENARSSILRRLGFPGAQRATGAASLVPVAVHGRPQRERYVAGGPLLVDVTLANGLPGPVQFSTFSRVPNEWNGETQGIELVNVYRDGGSRNLYLGRPTVEVPDGVSGSACLVVPREATLSVLVDLAKWKVAGGWTAGTYDLIVSVDGIVVDETVTLSVRSAPIRLVIE